MICLFKSLVYLPSGCGSTSFEFECHQWILVVLYQYFSYDYLQKLFTVF